MKLHLLEYFAVLAEELHFGRAAQRLSITQPPLSSAIKSLEEELGVCLFERSSRHVMLTAAGKVFLTEVRHILQRMQQAQDAAKSVASGLNHRLEVGVTGSMIYREAMAIVQAFHASVPNTEVTLREMSSTEQIEALQHQRIDAGFVNADTVPAPLAMMRLPADALVCCLPEKHRLAKARWIDLAELADERFILFSREVAPANYDSVIAVFTSAGIHPKFSHTPRQWLTVVALVAAGMGVALVPSGLASSGIRGAKFVPLKNPTPRNIGLLAWDRSRPTPALEAFIATARDALRARARNQKKLRRL